MGNDINQFQGIKITRGRPQVSHLFFANDALLFFKATEESCRQVNNIIGRFCAISGQDLNLQKSHFKVSPNTPLEMRQRFKHILQMELVSALSTHLGVPIDLTGPKHSNFQFIVDKIAIKINSWSYIPLAQSQKIILINSVLIAMASHVLSCMEVPALIVSKIDAMVAKFFWANKGNKGMHWVNKGTIYLPKGLGGLGIRGMGSLKKALLMKQASRLFNNPQHAGGNLWTWKVIHFILRSGLGWDHAKIKDSFEFEDSRRIVAMELPLSTEDDFIYWRYHKSGKFTVKSAYAMLISEDLTLSYNTPPSDFYKNLWSLKIPPKWKLFIWKLLHNGIATKVRLHLRGIQMEVVCDFCANGEEDIQHIFRFETIVQQVWRDELLAIHSEINETTSFKSSEK
ncbi:uncharacterized protein [Spinacia oleracea]|uniref:Reverse transcriptase zinc-binding domain-containing protein n=1 Tax=Spinacia oleracea TaxID=3562 RepID=A0ABM3RQP3_SPIOL|nr:uncharacterized protein LOC130471694 [Spinacia oleracea]